MFWSVSSVPMPWRQPATRNFRLRRMDAGLTLRSIDESTRTQATQRGFQEAVSLRSSMIHGAPGGPPCSFHGRLST
ncbi:MAG: hypothetical protein MZV64_35640 [Ignavibacteriales bacterium]|nr:hypothetical protein [Ignavibacteriales bacterium]